MNNGGGGGDYKTKYKTITLYIRPHANILGNITLHEKITVQG